MRHPVPLAATMAVILGVPASAVTRAAVPRAGVLAAPVLPGALRLATPSLTPSPLTAAALPTPTLAPALAAPASAPEVRLTAAAEAMAPALEVLAAPAAASAETRAAGDAVMAALLGAPADAPVAAAGLPAAPAPVLDLAGAERKYARGVGSRARALFADTLKRRQAGWRQGLLSLGVKAGAPLALTVTKSADRSPGAAAVVAETSFDVEWSQGPTKVGAFKVTVRLKDLRVTFSRQSAPAVPASRKVNVRVMSTASPAELAAFFESKGLRVLSQGRTTWTVAATGKTTAAQAVKRLSREKKLVLYAASASKAAPKTGVLVVRLRAPLDDAGIAAVLKAAKVSMVEEGRDGLWTVAANGKAADSLSRLRKSAQVLYAVPASMKEAEDRQVVLTFKEGTGDAQIAALLSMWKADVVREYGGGRFKLQVRTRRDAAFFSADPLVASVVAVGAVSEESVKGSAASAAAHKGRPWSQTEFNAQTYYSRVHLETSGATKAQLELFDRLVDAAPVLGGGFNPYSGD